MGSVVLLFLFAALALFLLGCKEGIILLKKRNRIWKTTGRIVDVSTLAAETMKVYNSKWALVMYSVDGRMITSQNRIVVPMSSNVGDPVDIQYDRDNPNVLISQNPKRFIVFMLCSVMTLIIAMVLKTRWYRSIRGFKPSLYIVPKLNNNRPSQRQQKQ